MSRVRAPELPNHYPWLNCDRPLSLQELRGRVVILDFWTYGCINCLHVLPTLKYLEQKYPESLTVIGVHSAKFEHEKEADNIQQAILRYDIEHPVLVDSSFRVWQQYAVRAWPTLVVIDPAGYVVASVAGEGDRDKLDELIADLLRTHQGNGTLQKPAFALEKQHCRLITPLAFPGKVLVDTVGHPRDSRLFIADSGHHRLVVSTLEGEVLQVIGSGQPGLMDGSFADAQFFGPQGMTFDRAHQHLYVADTGNHALRQVDLSTQQVKTIAGTGAQSRVLYPHGGSALQTPLNSPWDVELVEGTLFIAMAGPHQLWQLSIGSGTVQTYVGTGAEACVDGSIAEAAFAQPSGLTSNGQELFVADSESSSIRAVELSYPPQVRTICGSGDLFGFGDADGVGGEVRLQHCLGVEFVGDSPCGELRSNRLWIADTYNHKIKCVNPKTGECQTVLGSGQAGFQDGSGLGADFAEPSGLSATQSHLYVADTNNHALRRVELETLTVSTVTFPGLCAPGICVPQT